MEIEFFDEEVTYEGYWVYTFDEGCICSPVELDDLNLCPRAIYSNCKVEIWSSPDGRMSLGWYRGE